MPNCESIDPLVTPYVDGQIGDADRRAVDEHLLACPPCHSRVAAERAVRELIQTRKPALTACCAPDALHMRCAQQVVWREEAGAAGAPPSPARALLVGPPGELAPLREPRWRVAPFAAAASLVAVVGSAFLYQLTSSSSRAMAAELTADHLKCFAINGVLHTHDDETKVESSMLSGFGWRMHLPEASQADLELVGSRPCLYGEGKIAHIMYQHHGEPVSIFMLPKTARAQEFVQVLGHQAAIWCANNRTFVLVTREPKEEAERMASVVQASLR